MTKKTKTLAKSKKKQPAHYVDNEKFYEAMKEYKLKCFEAEEEHKKKIAPLIEDGVAEEDLPECEYPRVTEYIGTCVFLIATRLSNSPSFYSYSFKDEMIADGYEDCILRIKSFDHERFNKPFAYFTQICYYAFLRRIKKEKKQKTVKSEMIKNSGALEYFQNNQGNTDDNQYENTYLKFLMDNLDDAPTDAEKAQSKRKVIKKTTKAYQKKQKELEEQREIERERELRVELEEMQRAAETNILADVPEETQDYYDQLEQEEGDNE